MREHALRWRADHGHQHRGPTDRGRQPNNTHWPFINFTGFVKKIHGFTGTIVFTVSSKQIPGTK